MSRRRKGIGREESGRLNEGIRTAQEANKESLAVRRHSLWLLIPTLVCLPLSFWMAVGSETLSHRMLWITLHLFSWMLVLTMVEIIRSLGEHRQSGLKKIAVFESLLDIDQRRMAAFKAADHQSRSKTGHLEKDFTAEEWIALCHEYNHTCLCCKRRAPDIQLTPDHVVPLALGGTNGISNIQPLCLDCNRRKNARYVDYR